MKELEDFIKSGSFPDNEGIYLDSFITFTKDDFVDGNIILDISEFSYVETKLILKNAEFHGDFEDGAACFDDTVIEKTADGYILNCSLNDNYITFEDFEYTLKPLKVSLEFFGNKTPWGALFNFAYCIYEKLKLCPASLNEKEKALEPMLRDFAELKFETLRAKFPNDKKLSKLIKEVSRNNAVRLIFGDGDNELNKYLSSPKFEKAWREILDLLVDSQNEYGDNSALSDLKDLKSFRSYIDAVMLENGYTGEYPNYRKTAKSKGFHLVSKNGEKSLVRGKAVTIFAEFQETEYTNYGDFKPYFYITLQDPESITDKYSCLFSEKGFVKTAHLNYEVDENGNAHFEHGYLDIPIALCKAAEFKHLTASERKSLFSAENKLSIPFIISFSFICSLLGGIITVLSLILLEALIMLLFGRISEFPEIFADTPWHLIFLFCLLLTTVILSLYSIISQKLGY